MAMCKERTPMSPFDQFPEICQQIVEVCQRLHQRNMLAAADGNVSVRIDDFILITPSGQPKGFMKPQDVLSLIHI